MILDGAQRFIHAKQASYQLSSVPSPENFLNGDNGKAWLLDYKEAVCPLKGYEELTASRRDTWLCLPFIRTLPG